MNVLKTTRMIPIQLGWMTCIGFFSQSFPMPLGNYFIFASGEQCTNMWWENLIEWKQRNQIEAVQCTVLTHRSTGISLAIVEDEKIPSTWLHEQHNISGCRELIDEYCRYVNVSAANRYCGCELPDEFPHLLFVTDGSNHVIIHCLNCRRVWNV